MPSFKSVLHLFSIWWISNHLSIRQDQVQIFLCERWNFYQHPFTRACPCHTALQLGDWTFPSLDQNPEGQKSYSLCIPPMQLLESSPKLNQTRSKQRNFKTNHSNRLFFFSNRLLNDSIKLVMLQGKNINLAHCMKKWNIFTLYQVCKLVDQIYELKTKKQKEEQRFLKSRCWTIKWKSNIPSCQYNSL